MAETIKVRAVEGRSMPHEHDPRKHVTGTQEVPNTLHYRRALARGDIELVPVETASKKKAEG